MYKKFVVVTMLLAGGFVWYNFDGFFPDEKDRIRRELTKLLDHGKVDKKLTPLQTASTSQKILNFLDDKTFVSFTYREKEYSKTGKENLKTPLFAGLSRLRDFKFTLMEDKIKVDGSRAEASVDVRGRGEIIDYMEFFSEIHKFKLKLQKKDDQWIIKEIQHIPRQRFN